MVPRIARRNGAPGAKPGTAVNSRCPFSPVRPATRRCCASARRTMVSARAVGQRPRVVLLQDQNRSAAPPSNNPSNRNLVGSPRLEDRRDKGDQRRDEVLLTFDLLAPALALERQRMTGRRAAPTPSSTRCPLAGSTQIGAPCGSSSACSVLRFAGLLALHVHRGKKFIGARDRCAGSYSRTGEAHSRC